MPKWFDYFRRAYTELKQNSRSRITFTNFWDFEKIEDLWFYRFIQHRQILEKTGLSHIDFYSVFGSRRWMNYKLKSRKNRLSIFYTGENLVNYPAFADHALGITDLSIGFEHLSDDRYYRFPLWILYIIQPEWGIEDINNHVINFGTGNNLHDRKFCCLVASHDRNSLREEIFMKLSKIAKVDSGGKLLKNTDDLRLIYHNNKQAFLKNYKFNICPENSNTLGYTTEKLFQSLESGCIPIYWGSQQNPENDIINQSSLLFYIPGEENGQLLEKINLINNDASCYNDWFKRPKFKADAGQLIFKWMNDFESKILEAAKRFTLSA